MMSRCDEIEMYRVIREQLSGWAQITTRAHLWFMAVRDGAVLATPKFKWFQNVLSLDFFFFKEEQSSSKIPLEIFFVLSCLSHYILSSLQFDAFPLCVCLIF